MLSRVLRILVLFLFFDIYWFSFLYTGFTINTFIFDFELLEAAKLHFVQKRQENAMIFFFFFLTPIFLKKGRLDASGSARGGARYRDPRTEVHEENGNYT